MAAARAIARSCTRWFLGELPQSWLPKALVYQLFTNLLRNACHYAPEARAPIEVGYWDEGSRVTYFVRDYGHGVPFQEREAPLAISNVMYVCPVTQKPTRVGIRRLEDGRRARFSKKSNETFE